MSGDSMNLGQGNRSLSRDRLRLVTKVARMYHEQGMRQPQIASQLNLSQARVSRLLKEAVDLGIVRTTVVSPPGIHTEIEEDLQKAYGLQEAVVVDSHADTEEALLLALGSAAAVYLDTTLTGGDLIGISSWSSSLLATVEVMRPKRTSVAETVVQIVGGVGNPNVQVQATRLTGNLADLTGADPIFMPAPGLVGSANVRRALLKDPAVTEVMALWERLTMVLVGIGSLEPSSLLRQSGNAIAPEDQAELREKGAVGDVCLRFFDAEGRPVKSNLDQRVLGITPDRLREVGRRVAVAGGDRKYSAILGALRGQWINVLVTDLAVATRLVEDAGGVPPTGAADGRPNS